MSESIILKSLTKCLYLISNSYKFSLFNKIFCKIDGFLKNSALNSILLRPFTRESSKKLVCNSLICSTIVSAFEKAKKIFPAINSTIANSRFVKLSKDLVSASQNYPIRVVCITGIAFLISNISFSVITGSAKLTSLLAKLLLLAALMLFRNIALDFRKVISDSKFYRLFLWMISYND